MTRRLWTIVLIAVAIALLVGLITPWQLGDWVRLAAAWFVEVGRDLVEGVRDLVAG